MLVLPVSLLSLAVLVAGDGLDQSKSERLINQGSMGVITGTVVDPVTGDGVSRVQVRARAASGTTVAATVTNDVGEYELDNLPDGTYTIMASRANYVVTSTTQTNGAGGPTVSILGGRVVEAINIQLQRAAVIAGHISDELGDPMVDVQVMAMRYQYIRGRRRLLPVGDRATTDDLGEFRLYGLTPGIYYVSVLVSMAASQVAPSEVSRLVYPQTFYPGTTNSSEAQPLLAAAAETATVSFSVSPTRAVSVAGSVFDSEGRAVARASVSAARGLGELTAGLTVTSGVDGRYTLNGLTAGDYVFRISAPEQGEAATQTVRVASDDIAYMDFVTSKPTLLRGRVLFNHGGSSQRIALPNTTVTARMPDPLQGASARVRSDMTFELHLQAGRVIIQTDTHSPTAAQGQGLTAEWHLRRVTWNGSDVTDGWDIPANGSVSDVAIEISDDIRGIAGRVTSESRNESFQTCEVIAFAQDPLRWGPDSRYVSAVNIAHDGRFHLDLPAGVYSVIAVADVEAGAWNSVDYLTRLREKAVRVVVEDGGVARVDLVLMRPQF